MRKQAHGWWAWAEGYKSHASQKKCPYPRRSEDAAMWRAGQATAKTGLIPCNDAIKQMAGLNARLPATFEDALGMHATKWEHLPHSPSLYRRLYTSSAEGFAANGRNSTSHPAATPPLKLTANVTPEPDMAAREKWSGDTDA